MPHNLYVWQTVAIVQRNCPKINSTRLTTAYILIQVDAKCAQGWNHLIRAHFLPYGATWDKCFLWRPPCGVAKKKQANLGPVSFLAVFPLFCASKVWLFDIIMVWPGATLDSRAGQPTAPPPLFVVQPCLLPSSRWEKAEWTAKYTTNITCGTAKKENPTKPN